MSCMLAGQQTRWSLVIIMCGVVMVTLFVVLIVVLVIVFGSHK